MKKSSVFLLGLIGIDQIIKLFIAYYFMNVNVVLLPDILLFNPIQNTNLNWIASMLEYKTPVLLMIVIQIFDLTIIYLSYRYLSYLYIQGKKLLNRMLILFIAGILCSFIDVVFWGGSVDYLRLFNLVTFDFKDVYLDIGIALFLFYIANYYTCAYHKMSKKERKQTGIWHWIKKGMPSFPTE